MSIENDYIRILTKLNRATRNGSKAPHKPILLLSVIQAFEQKEILENKIKINAQLVARFKDNWKWLVKDDFFTPNFALPFYHLINDGFWHLQVYPDKELVLTSSLSIKSFMQLKETIHYAFLDEPLFNLLKENESRKDLYNRILYHYFPTHQDSYPPLNLIEEIKQQILHDSETSYQHKTTTADEEEIFVRGVVFKKTIPPIYNHTCCISGMQLITGYDIQMIDACHIIPFSVSKNDIISNGISLCPNLHRAFDRGLLSIDDDYKVIVSDCFSETPSYSIKLYHGKRIILPENIEYYPSVQNLQWHRTFKFKK